MLAMTALVALTFLGCGSASTTGQEHDSGAEVHLNVFAAASLQQAFEEVGQRFMLENPNVNIAFHFGGSSTLVQNLEAGAPADVFAAADEINMAKAEAAHLIDEETHQVFASNTLVGIVPSDNSAKISTLDEANSDDVNLVVCAPQVPCGALSQRLAENAGIELNPVSEEQQVSDVLGKVRSGQADAGLVYATDAVLAPDEVATFEIEGADQQLNYYPIARTSNAQAPEAADAFVNFVRSEAGRSVLESDGFTIP